MQRLKGSVINSIILGRSHFCCLCFETVVDHAVHIEDYVIVRKRNKIFKEVYMIDILRTVLGSELNDQLSIFNAVCNQCSSQLIKSYKFLTKCKENSQKIGRVIDSLTNGTEICLANAEGSKAGFVSINTDNLESRGFNSMSTSSTGAAAYQKYLTLRAKDNLKIKPAIAIIKPAPEIAPKPKVMRLRLARLNSKVLNKTMFVCPICDKYFVRRHSMHLHYKKKHSYDVKRETDKIHSISSHPVINTDEDNAYFASPQVSLIESVLQNGRFSYVVEIEPTEDNKLSRKKVPNILKRRSKILPKTNN